jgi:hypothetical protein
MKVVAVRESFWLPGDYGVMNIRFVFLVFLMLLSKQSTEAKEPVVYGCETAKTSPALFDSIQKANDKIGSVLDCIEFPSAAKTIIVWKPGKNGEVTNISIEASSGTALADIACIEAVIAASPEGEVFRTVERRAIQFPLATKKGHPGTTPKVDFPYVHRIPLTVKLRYPSLFKDDELFSDQNRVRLPSNDSKEAIRLIGKIYSSWNAFFHNSERFTREDIAREAEKLSEKYGLGKDLRSDPKPL